MPFEMNIVWAILFLAAGLVILWKSADLLVDGAVGFVQCLKHILRKFRRPAPAFFVSFLPLIAHDSTSCSFGPRQVNSSPDQVSSMEHTL